MPVPRLHSSLTAERVLDLVAQDDMLGACIICGEEADHVEPDARRYHCECCGERAVFGAEELLFMLPLAI